MAFSIDFKGRPTLKHIALYKIVPNPHQPRKIFDAEALRQLADSITQHGIITPLTVRREGERYVLIAGERRLRASKLAGLDTVPCYVLEADDGQSAAMALVENLQRRDLDPFEEAEGLVRLTRDFGLTQQQAAEKIGRTQAAVANKMRLLKLHKSTIEIIREYGLSERHGRALLALEDEEEQNEAARHIADHGLNVARSEEYIARLIEKRDAPKPKRQLYIKDIRFFLNSVTKAVDSVRSAGIDAVCTKTDEEDGIRLTILIPAKRG